MATQQLVPFEEILSHIKNKQNFVLQGGAGSGKTETLKRVVQGIFVEKPTTKVVCITHTNKAADEIAERILGSLHVSTIHSFLGELIRPFKENIKVVLPEIFILPHFERLGKDEAGDGQKSKQKSEKDRFDKAHKKLATRRLSVLGDKPDKVVGKKIYDQDPETYIYAHNSRVTEVNEAIKNSIAAADPNAIKYNETPFNSFRDTSYSHDGLIQIASLLIERYPFLRKIFADKFDCIFIDEYQDTHKDVIKSLVQVTAETNLCLGLFGDSEQSIYEDGIGDVQTYIADGTLQLVEKKDNFRCSQPVIDIANSFRCDGLEQEIAFKLKDDGTRETLEDRKGSAKLYFAYAPTKNAQDSETQAETNKRHKTECASLRDCLVNAVVARYPEFTQLKLTNKSIAMNLEFGTLWDIFDANFFDTRDQIKRNLARLQFEQFFELVELYKALPGDRRAYNKLITIVNRSGTVIRQVSDKVDISKDLEYLTNSKLSAYEAIQFALGKHFISQSDSHKSYILNKKKFLEDFRTDEIAQEFCKLVEAGYNTKVRLIALLKKEPKPPLTIEIIDQEFEALEQRSKKYDFFTTFFSKELKISEIIRFYEYEKGDGNLVTMHKTKGTGIENVIVVCDEYGWQKDYDFKSCFSIEPPKSPREVQSRKLLYVACSRTKSNLVAVRLIHDESELTYLKTIFPEVEEIAISPSVVQ